MRRLLLIGAMAALAVALVPADANARPGARSGAPRFAPRLPSQDLRIRFNRELMRGLHLGCTGRPIPLRCR
jgi:hypothetical protein